MGVEQAYIERIKAARARMGMSPPRPVVNIDAIKLKSPVTAPIESTEEARKAGRPKGSKDDIETRRHKEAAERYAIALEARRRMLAEKATARLSAASTINICSKFFGVDPSVLKKGGGNSPPLPYFRQTTIFMAKEVAPALSLNVLGKIFGGYDHTTVLHSMEKIQKLLNARDPRTTSDIANLRMILLGVEMREDNYWGC